MLLTNHRGTTPALPPLKSAQRSGQRTIVSDLVAAQTLRTPRTPAIWVDGHAISYEALDAWSNGIAQSLAQHDVKADVPVAIALPRGAAQIAAILGVLKAGGAYVPVDLAYPAARIDTILDSAKVAVLLTDDANAGRFAKVDADLLKVSGEEIAAEPPRQTATARDLAYVIYTSGSTGRPKGVAMPHGPLLNLIQWQAHESADLPPGARTLQFSSISFDVSFQEIFATLSTGGTLVLVSDELRRDADDLWRFLCVAEVNRIFLPFVALQQLADAAARSHRTADALREIITAGEQLRVTPQLKALMRRLPGCRLENQYGPSETHVVTAYTMPADIRHWPALPPIGHEIPGAEIVILNDRMQPVKPGETGELFIAGDCLARGYMHRPDLTAERFIASPLPEQLGRRLYRSGDLARRLADGEIEFLGRADDQVKIRGYRIEPGEIENVLSEHPSLRSAAVVVREQRICAYVVKKAETTLAEIRDFLKSRIAEYMMPSVIMFIPALPLTPSGKLDRRSLPEPDEQNTTTGPAPRTRLEARLLGMWEAILHTKGFGVQTSFFDLGGHSLLVGQMIATVEREFGRTVGCAAFYENPTIEFLAECLSNGLKSTPRAPIVTIHESGKQTPFVFFHGDFVKGDGYCNTLAAHLGKDRPIHVIQPHGMDGETPPSTIAEMAKNRFEAVRSLRVGGKWILGGYSNGGLIAYETARMLTALGERVAGVVMIGSEPRVLQHPLTCRFAALKSRLAGDTPFARQSRYLQTLNRVQYFKAAAEKFAALPIAQKLVRLAKKLLPSKSQSGGPCLGEDPLTRLCRIYGEAYEGWMPQEFDGRTILLWPEEDAPATPGNPAAEWQTISPNTTWRTIPGDHHSAVAMETHLREVAAQLRIALSELEA